MRIKTIKSITTPASGGLEIACEPTTAFMDSNNHGSRIFSMRWTPLSPPTAVVSWDGGQRPRPAEHGCGLFVRILEPLRNILRCSLVACQVSSTEL